MDEKIKNVLHIKTDEHSFPSKVNIERIIENRSKRTLFNKKYIFAFASPVLAVIVFMIMFLPNKDKIINNDSMQGIAIQGTNEVNKGMTENNKNGNANDPNQGTVSEPNKEITNNSNKGMATNPNKDTVIEPNKEITNNSNKGIASNPNKGTVTQPNQGIASDPNKGVAIKPNNGIANEPKVTMQTTEQVEYVVYNQQKFIQSTDSIKPEEVGEKITTIVENAPAGSMGVMSIPVIIDTNLPFGAEIYSIPNSNNIAVKINDEWHLFKQEK